MASNCACGRPLPTARGIGRPRVRCELCSADHSALGKAWRLRHPAEVDAYNAARREEWRRAHQSEEPDRVPSTPTFTPGAAAPQPSPDRDRPTNPMPEVRATRGNHAGNPGAGETL